MTVTVSLKDSACIVSLSTTVVPPFMGYQRYHAYSEHVCCAVSTNSVCVRVQMVGNLLYH